MINVMMFSTATFPLKIIQIEFQKYISKRELLRKLIHILSCIASLIFLPFFSLTFGLIGSISFITLIIWFDSKGFFNTLKRHRSISWGQYFMFLGILFNFIYLKTHSNLPLAYHSFVFSLLTLAFADTFAILGRPLTNILKTLIKKTQLKPSIKAPILKFFNISPANKTLLGAGIFTITTFSILILVGVFAKNIDISLNFVLKSILLSFLMALIELISPFGLDNLLISIIGIFGFLAVYS
jgi:hypothetical protein